MKIQHIYSFKREDFEKELKGFVGSLQEQELRKIKYSTSHTPKGIYFSALILYERLDKHRYINEGE